MRGRSCLHTAIQITIIAMETGFSSRRMYRTLVSFCLSQPEIIVSAHSNAYRYSSSALQTYISTVGREFLFFPCADRPKSQSISTSSIQYRSWRYHNHYYDIEYYFVAGSCGSISTKNSIPHCLSLIPPSCFSLSLFSLSHSFSFACAPVMCIKKRSMSTHFYSYYSSSELCFVAIVAAHSISIHEGTLHETSTKHTAHNNKSR